MVVSFGKLDKSEFHKSLVNVGIITDKGELTKDYRLVKKKPKAKKKTATA